MTIIIQNLKRISIVESEGFCEFNEFMHIAVPDYIVLCRMTITRQIDQMAKRKSWEEKFKSSLDK